MLQIPVTAIVTALCALLLVGLSAHISRLRFKHKVSLGDGGVNPLLRAVRLHGNTTEHAPIFILLCAAFELSVGTDPLLQIIAGLFLLSRALYTWGMLTKIFTRQRIIGTLGTYVAQTVLAVALLIKTLA